jgi:hypothetical protein
VTTSQLLTHKAVAFMHTHNNIMSICYYLLLLHVYTCTCVGEASGTADLHWEVVWGRSIPLCEDYLTGRAVNFNTRPPEMVQQWAIHTWKFLRSWTCIKMKSNTPYTAWLPGGVSALVHKTLTFYMHTLNNMCAYLQGIKYSIMSLLSRQISRSRYFSKWPLQSKCRGW